MEELGIYCTIITTIVGICIGCVTYGNYKLAIRKRKDDLFDRRYAFYKRLENIWLNSGDGAPPNCDPNIDTNDLLPLAQEAEFLFGKDIQKHILDPDIWNCKSTRFFGIPDEDFIQPFFRYLRF